MQNRQRLLVIGLIAVVAVWQGWGVVDGWVFAPLRDRGATIARLEKQVDAAMDLQDRLDQALRDLEAWKKISLPPEPTAAANMYQQWLVELTSKHKFEACSVAPKAITSNLAAESPVFQVVTMEVRATARLGRLADFLAEFHKMPLLHRVATAEIKAAERRDSDPPLEIVMKIEGLSLKAAEPRTSLLPDEKSRGKPWLPELAPDAWGPFVKENLFARTYNGPPRPAPTTRPDPPMVVRAPDPPREPPFDPTPYLKLVGHVRKGDATEVWLFDQANNKSAILSAGSKFTLAGIQGEIVSIGDSYAIVQLKSEQFRLELGQSFREMKKIGGTAAAEPPSAAAETPPTEDPAVPKTPGGGAPAEASAESPGKPGETTGSEAPAAGKTPGEPAPSPAASEAEPSADEPGDE